MDASCGFNQSDFVTTCDRFSTPIKILKLFTRYDLCYLHLNVITTTGAKCFDFIILLVLIRFSDNCPLLESSMRT